MLHSGYSALAAPALRSRLLCAAAQYFPPPRYPCTLEPCVGCNVCRQDGTHQHRHDKHLLYATDTKCIIYSTAKSCSCANLKLAKKSIRQRTHPAHNSRLYCQLTTAAPLLLSLYLVYRESSKTETWLH